MPANVDAMVQSGIRAFREGNKAEARTLLEKAAELDQYNEQAWLWLSAVVDTPEEQRTCLENVIFINPNNESAKKGLASLTSDIPGIPEKPASSAPAQESNPFTESFASTQSSPFSESLLPEEDSYIPPTATSSASSTFVPRDEPSAAEYDDWVAGLGLGSSSSEADSFSSAFADENAGSAFDAIDEALSSNDAFSTTDAFPFGQGFFDDDTDDTDRQASGTPPMMDTDDDDPFGAKSLMDERLSRSIGSSGGRPTPKSRPSPGKSVDTSQPVGTPVSPTSASTPIMSPGAENTDAARFLDSLGDVDAAEKVSGGLYDPDDDYDPDTLGEPDPAEYFQRIPRNITATRLPGTKEGYPLPLLVGVIVLVMLNIGAVGWLIANLAG